MVKTKSKQKSFYDFITDFAPESVEPGDDVASLEKGEAFFKENGYIAVMDPANVAMVATNNRTLAAFMINALDLSAEEFRKFPDLKFEVQDAAGAAVSSKYSPEYLKVLLKFVVAFDVVPRFYMRRDYPLMVVWELSGGSWVKYLLAPRAAED